MINEKDRMAVSCPDGTEMGEVLLSRYRRIKLPDWLGPEWTGELVISPSLPPNGVWIFTLPLWEAMQQHIMALNSYDKLNSAAQRLVVGLAEHVLPRLDGSYRIPIAIASKVKLPRKLVLVIKAKGLALLPVDAGQS